MREILFRGQIRRKGEKIKNFAGDPMPSKWVYGGVSQSKYTFSVIYGQKPVAQYPVYSDTVGQYTGLTDKNDKEIFEGDIVSTPKYGVDDGRGRNYCGKDKFVVRYADGTYTLENKRRVFCLRPDADAEVIGNIYDNPELLEAKNG